MPAPLRLGVRELPLATSGPSSSVPGRLIPVVAVVISASLACTSAAPVIFFPLRVSPPCACYTVLCPVVVIVVVVELCQFTDKPEGCPATQPASGAAGARTLSHQNFGLKPLRRGFVFPSQVAEELRRLGLRRSFSSRSVSEIQYYRRRPAHASIGSSAWICPTTTVALAFSSRPRPFGLHPSRPSGRPQTNKGTLPGQPFLILNDN